MARPDLTHAFKTAPVPDRVHAFRTQRTDVVHSFATGLRPDVVHAFRTQQADVVHAFVTNAQETPPAGLSFVADLETGLVVLTFLPGTQVLNDPFVVRVTRIRDNAGVEATGTLATNPTRLVVTFGTSQDGVYHVRTFDATGALLFDVYLPVMPRGWRCWRAVNQPIATSGRKGDGGDVTPTWKQLLARLKGAESLVDVLDPGAADRLILSLGRWCGPTGQLVEPCGCSC